LLQFDFRKGGGYRFAYDFPGGANLGRRALSSCSRAVLSTPRSARSCRGASPPSPSPPRT
jgi:hypothetical protein